MSTYEISKSSLLSLKAEILKKQGELQSRKAENNIRLQKNYKKPLGLKITEVDGKTSSQYDDIDPNVLQKSRIALEEKSKLYDKLSMGSLGEEEELHNRKYLVHFDKKKHYALIADEFPQISDDNSINDRYSDDDEGEWVEFVDSFGRTRTCLKQDLAQFKAKDKELQVMTAHKASESPLGNNRDDGENNEMQKYNGLEVQFNDQREMLSSDMRREIQRQQWEREEESLKDKSDLHYQDILFSEARTHGVAYYEFSKDEVTRKQQQTALNALRRETEAQQKQAQEVRRNREKQLRARVRAAKNRKRAREGLPPITSDDEDEQRIANEEDSVEPVGQHALDEEQDDRNISRKLHVRPWDVGKKQLDVEKARKKSGAHDPFNQDEWNAIERRKRIAEFAPPQHYSATRPNKCRPCGRPIQNECSETDDFGGSTENPKLHKIRRTCTPPLSTMEQCSLGDQHKHRKQSDMQDAILQGLKFLRERVEQKNQNSVK